MPAAATTAVSVALAPGVIATTDAHFKCWTIDSSDNRQFMGARAADLNDPQLRYLAQASLPGYLRFGGTGNDQLVHSMAGPGAAGTLNASRGDR